jgi:hypothetical protein
MKLVDDGFMRERCINKCLILTTDCFSARVASLYGRPFWKSIAMVTVLEASAPSILNDFTKCNPLITESHQIFNFTYHPFHAWDFGVCGHYEKIFYLSTGISKINRVRLVLIYMLSPMGILHRRTTRDNRIQFHRILHSIWS